MWKKVSYPTHSSETNVASPIHIELEDLDELVRMVVASASPEQASLFRFQLNGSTIFSTLIILPGWMDLRALPVLVFIRAPEDIGLGRFLRYNIFDKDPKAEFVNRLDEKEIATGTIRYVPIIHIKRPPSIFFVPD